MGILHFHSLEVSPFGVHFTALYAPKEDRHGLVSRPQLLQTKQATPASN
jgi:hypothetical protein